MTTQTANYLNAIAHLPAGGTLILGDVPWSEYEQLLADLGEGYAVRMSYDQGRLEVMTPSSKHEKYKRVDLAPRRHCRRRAGLRSRQFPAPPPSSWNNSRRAWSLIPAFMSSMQPA
jgi:hypothetical protein